MKFIAPERHKTAPELFGHPIFDHYRAYEPWLIAKDWPTSEMLNAAFQKPRHRFSGACLDFTEQTPTLLQDGLHYERRIFDRGQIATRGSNWHDLLNALAWMRWREIKMALNARYCADLEGGATAERTRAQCALTHFDEAGAIVALEEPDILRQWDAHDWHGTFWENRHLWGDGGARCLTFGHALLEHALLPPRLLVAKAIVIVAPKRFSMDDVALHVAQAIHAQEILRDPQELRPLPLCGLPGWHPDGEHEFFYRSAECFKPVREGRRYPAPLSLPAMGPE